MANSVDSIYGQVREMAANFEFKPEERINESALSKALGASRTPLREALNRLVAEGLLYAQDGKGFFCRSLSPEKILHLYELREAIETHAGRLAVARASDDELRELRDYLKSSQNEYVPGTPPHRLAEMDEGFHMRVVGLAHNPELVRALQNIYVQIRYVRLIAIRNKLDLTHTAHSGILEALMDRNADLVTQRLADHVRTSNEEATQTVRQAYSQLYVPS
ncbi:GntR family transcriptional regulator [Pelagimonas varians]|uniref:HTH-type transcriptional repressor CsiR n=1 Tax=Pelagimonas varians TaxID=696760 RepID=A0A238K9M0_9RHOB|nr:GntR family transcriptional regulator [Pelagimonas varians]PYG31076.1 GntR family transcriptional regulator [Pelagimonas varians]SMX39588.1 HTH-type transcriptional repressor CsiR [Pelagimonas varians]